MSQAASVDIKDMLVAVSSLSLTYKTNLFIGREIDTTANVVTIYDTGGVPHNMLNQESNPYEFTNAQVRVRNESYVDAFNLAHSIMKSLHGRAQETWNGTLYSVINCISGPTLLEWGDDNKAIFVINFELQRR